MEVRGSIKSWNDDKGFGFIQPEQGKEPIFVHISAVRGDRRPVAGDSVMYVASLDQQGRMRAEHMRHAGGLAIDQPAIRRKPRAQGQSKPREVSGPAGNPVRRAKPVKRQHSHSAIQHLGLKLLIFVALCCLPGYGALQALKAGSVWLISAYTMLSLISFYQYWSDKNSAQKGRWRTPENVLHAVELCGGWPGALVAQQVFRHKTRKLSFQLVFWVIIAIHQAFWLDYLLFDGVYLRSLVGISFI